MFRSLPYSISLHILIVFSILFISTMRSMDYGYAFARAVKGGFQKASTGLSRILVPFNCGPSSETMPTDILSEMDESLFKAPSKSINRQSSPTWRFIINGYCTRTKIKPGRTRSELYEKVYYNNRLTRAALLLSGYEQLCPSEQEYEIDHTALEELRILPSRECGVIDSLINKMSENTFWDLKRISRGTAMKLARMLAVHRSIKELIGWQQWIKTLAACKDDHLARFLRTATRHENYFMATFCPYNSSEIKEHVQVLRQYFPNAQINDLAGLAASPLLHGFYDQFSMENILSLSNDLSFSKQKEFWQEHVNGLYEFLKILTKIVGFLPDSECFKRISQILLNQEIIDSVSALRPLPSKIANSKNIETLNKALQRHLVPLYSFSDSMLTAYNTWANVSLAFSLSKLLNSHILNYASFINDDLHPEIHLKDGKCLLLDYAKPYSVDFNVTEKNTALVTGKNFSGKSIFMQTLASNVHLALSLGVVAAKKMKLTPMDILSSCNIHDSVGTSLWEAQAERVASVIKRAKESDRFSLVILDEPLTASSPKIINGVLPEVLKKIHENKRRVIGMISTHYSQPVEFVDENLDQFSHIQVNPDHTLNFIQQDANT